MAPGVLSPKGRKQAFHVSPECSSLDQGILSALEETAMRDAMVLFYNPPLMEMQKSQGILPKHLKSLKSIYKALLKKAFEDKRAKFCLPKSSSKEDIALAMAQHLNS